MIVLPLLSPWPPVGAPRPNRAWTCLRPPAKPPRRRPRRRGGEIAAAIEERNADLPAQILVVWRADTDLTLEFYPDGRLVEIKPSGNIWPGRYILSPDNTTLSITSDGNTNSSTVVISGTNTMLTFFQVFERVEVIEPDAAASRSLAGWVVSSYHTSWSVDVVYDFYPDGTYAITRGERVTVAGNYQLSDDETITLVLEPEKAPIALAVAPLADRWLLIGPGLLLRRVAAEPPGNMAPPVAAAVTATPLPTPIPAPAATPEPAATAAPVASRFITSQTSTGFVAVRERPTTASAEVRRLDPNTEVLCVGVVTGQVVAGSDQWA